MNYYSYELASMGYQEMDPMIFYRDIFPEGELAPDREKKDYVQGEYTGTALCITNKLKNNGKRLIKRYTITDDLDMIDLLMYSDDFCFMSPISYIGKTRESKNARYMYALCIEIDNLRVRKTKVRCKNNTADNHRIRYNKQKKIYEEYEYVGLHSLFDNFDEYFPRPTYVVSSGGGIHLYYIFDRAIPLYPNIARTIEIYKRALTKKLWNKKITFSYKEKDIQYESIYQGFRMPGTLTKVGLETKNKRDDITTAHKTGDKVTIEYLNKYVKKSEEMSVVYKSKLSLSKAKQLYPNWYQNRIVEKKEKGHWICSENVYNWWLNRISNETELGHRYYCMMMLVIYAIKCDIPREKLETDCLGLLDFFESLTEEETNHFTEKDMMDALQVFEDKEYVTYPINSIQNRSGLHIEKNKRNYRKQIDHLSYIRAIKKIKVERDECSVGGRPQKSEIVKKWQKEHPNGKKAQCIKDTGLSKPTVYKWWDNNKNDLKNEDETEILF